MNPTLDSILVHKFPRLYRDRCGDMKRTAMCWGFEVGDGWFQIIYDLSVKLEKIIEDASADSSLPLDHPDIWQTDSVAFQVKEKYGTLRFYMSSYIDGMDEAIEEAENLSAVTCEECGKPGTLNKRGWIKCRCREHTDDLESNT